MRLGQRDGQRRSIAVPSRPEPALAAIDETVRAIRLGQPGGWRLLSEPAR